MKVKLILIRLGQTLLAAAEHSPELIQQCWDRLREWLRSHRAD